MVIVPFPIPTSMVDRELDALIEASRQQRERGLIFSQEQIDEAERARLEWAQEGEI